MDVGKNPLIFQLVIRIDKETKQSTETYLIRLLSSTTWVDSLKETFLDLYLFILLRS